uniref:Ribonuclease PIN domain-containing protein n=1 Tax=Sus scrofa TaxID=9823 RepID=A0A8D1IES6_PIG
MAPVEHVVADAGAFLQNAALQDIGKNIYTIRDVVSEIRDKATRRRLAVLPYELRFKEPFPEYVRLGESEFIVSAPRNSSAHFWFPSALKGFNGITSFNLSLNVHKKQ